ncbi:unnamed protein product [Ectocarpus sp. 12 AP-2014]
MNSRDLWYITSFQAVSLDLHSRGLRKNSNSKQRSLKANNPEQHANGSGALPGRISQQTINPSPFHVADQSSNNSSIHASFLFLLAIVILCYVIACHPSYDPTSGRAEGDGGTAHQALQKLPHPSPLASRRLVTPRAGTPSATYLARPPPPDSDGMTRVSVAPTGF